MYTFWEDDDEDDYLEDDNEGDSVPNPEFNPDNHEFKDYFVHRLLLGPWQYTIIHNSIQDFKIGDKVFLFNPNHPMIIAGFYEGEIIYYLEELTEDGEISAGMLPYHCLKHMEDSILLEYEHKYKICLN